MRITLDPVHSVRRLPRRGIGTGPSGNLLRGPWPRGAGRAVMPIPRVQLVCQGHLRAAPPRPRKRGSQGGGSPKLKKGTPCGAAFLWLLLSSLCPSPTQLPAYSRRRINAGVIFSFILCSIHSLILPSFSFYFFPHSYSYFMLSISAPSLPPCHFLPLCTCLFLSLSSLSLSLSLCVSVASLLSCGSLPRYLSICVSCVSLPLSSFLRY